MFEIPRPNPNPIFLKARDLAGTHIQKLMAEDPKNFAWIRSELTSPSFDDMNFRYKNKVFSILIKVFQNGKEITDRFREVIFEEETRDNDLVPCVFSVNLDFIPTHSEHGYGIHIKKGEIPEYRLSLSGTSKWNLTHLLTGKDIDPFAIASDTPVVMSKYEMQNFAILVVREHLKKEGLKLESFCDAPGVVPQLWFQEKDGKRSWVYIDYGPKASLIATPDITEMTKGLLGQFNGYHAAVGLQLAKGDKPYRGSGFYVDFSGLKKIHSAK